MMPGMLRTWLKLDVSVELELLTVSSPHEPNEAVTAAARVRQAIVLTELLSDLTRRNSLCDWSSPTSFIHPVYESGAYRFKV
jgi:hypothetical protein